MGRREPHEEDGLANSTRPLPIARNQSDTTISSGLSWAEIGCSAADYAPQYAPRGAEIEQLGLEKNPPRLVNRCLDELHRHPSYVRHGLSPSAAQLSALAAIGEGAFQNPIHITSSGLIVDGYARWELAKRQGRSTLLCVEYDLNEQCALQWLIQTHRPSHGLSDFIRIELALDLESSLKDKARLNRREGGRLKGLSKLTVAEKVNSRTEVARVAQVSVGNVHKVKYILAHACSPLKEAARIGEISIHLAEKWSHEPHAKQHEYLRLLRIERGIKRKARHLVAAELGHTRLNPNQQVIRLSDLVTIVSELIATAPERSREFDSIEVKVVDCPGHAIFVTEALVRILTSQQEVLVR